MIKSDNPRNPYTTSTTGDRQTWEELNTVLEEDIPPGTKYNPYARQVGGNHYKEQYPFCEPLEFFSKNRIPFTLASACKYILRHELKGGIEDLRKAQHYLEVIAFDHYGEKL